MDTAGAEASTSSFEKMDSAFCAESIEERSPILNKTSCILGRKLIVKHRDQLPL